MSLFGGSSAASAVTPTATATGDISKDVALNNPPDDGISDLSFSPAGDFLSVASWDCKTRIYSVSEQGGSEGKAMITSDKPVLCTAWSTDGTKVVGAGANNQAQMLDLGSGSTTATQVAQHDQPIRCAKFMDGPGNSPMLVTGSWDRTVKYWDLRQAAPAATLQCQERVYSMDIKNKLLVIGTADRYVNVVNLEDPTKFYKTIQSPLKWQTRVVSCFTDSSGYAVGSVEGRCAIQFVEEKDAASNFSFKCHRDSPASPANISNVYSVNAISFHPEYGTFSTAGSDGTFHFWDGNAKHRLKGYPNVGGTISSTAFNRQGTVFAYAVSYDWSQGFAKNPQPAINKVMLHGVHPEEVKPRPGTKKR